jgi:hypothetical protein
MKPEGLAYLIRPVTRNGGTFGTAQRAPPVKFMISDGGSLAAPGGRARRGTANLVEEARPVVQQQQQVQSKKMTKRASLGRLSWRSRAKLPASPSPRDHWQANVKAGGDFYAEGGQAEAGNFTATSLCRS